MKKETRSIDYIFLSITATLVILGIFAFFLGIIIGILRYASIQYELGDYALRLNRGIISKAEISIPFKNIQDVDLNQSILLRIFGFATLVILSGGEDEKNEGNKEVFNVIDVNLAKSLREALTKKSEVQQVKEV